MDRPHTEQYHANTKVNEFKDVYVLIKLEVYNFCTGCLSHKLKISKIPSAGFKFTHQSPLFPHQPLREKKIVNFSSKQPQCVREKKPRTAYLVILTSPFLQDCVLQRGTFLRVWSSLALNYLNKGIVTRSL